MFIPIWLLVILAIWFVTVMSRAVSATRRMETAVRELAEQRERVWAVLTPLARGEGRDE